jgi:hypothetical protein
LFAEISEPAQDVGIASQLREMANLGMKGVEKAEETIHGCPVGHQSAGLQGGGQELQLRSKESLEAGLRRLAHGISGP